MKTFICLIFALLLSGCVDLKSPELKKQQKEAAEVEIKRTKEVKLYGTFDGHRISKVEFQNHDYYIIESQSANHYVVYVPVHDPDCRKCLAKSK